METIKIGYARCSTLSQDLEAQRKSLRELGVHENRIYARAIFSTVKPADPSLRRATKPQLCVEIRETKC